MKIGIATDSFKDSATAERVCAALERGIKAVNNNIETSLLPLADGGEGTANLLTKINNGSFVEVEVFDPLFRVIRAKYGLSADKKNAYIDMSAASGIQLLPVTDRNPCHTSTFGTGQLIKHAIDTGVEKIILGIGSSATNDCGVGMAAALGYKFVDKEGCEIRKICPTGKDLISIAALIEPANDWRSGVEVQVICDVENPLYGSDGAAHIYAPQKGATEEEVLLLDKGLESFAKVLEKHYGRDFNAVKGAGAAGGMGAGTLAFLDAELLPGIEAVLQAVDFEGFMDGCDYIFTGEGMIDSQTLNGKLITGITRRAKKKNIPVIAFCGTLAAKQDAIKAMGLQAAFSILSAPMSLGEAISVTEKGLEEAAFSVTRLLK